MNKPDPTWWLCIDGQRRHGPYDGKGALSYAISYMKILQANNPGVNYKIHRYESVEIEDV